MFSGPLVREGLLYNCVCHDNSQYFAKVNGFRDFILYVLHVYVYKTKYVT